VSAPSLRQMWEKTSPRDLGSTISDIRTWLLEVESQENFSEVRASIDRLAEIWEFGDPFLDLLGPALNDCSWASSPGSAALNIPATLIALFDLALEDGEATLGAVVASNPNCSEQLMEMMAESDLGWEDWSVPVAVATNPATPPSLLEKLADGVLLSEFSDYAESVRWAVASNPNAPAAVLESLAYDSGTSWHIRPAEGWLAEIRVAVTGNPTTPTRVLDDQLVYARELLANADDSDDEWLRGWISLIENTLAERRA